MADNEQNDEYQFGEFDSLDNESAGNAEYSEGNSQPTTNSLDVPKKNVRRNAFIVLSLVVSFMVLYKLFSGFFNGKNSTEELKGVPIAQIVPESKPEPIMPIEKTVRTVSQVYAPVVVDNTNVLKQKIDSIEENQQNLQTQVSSMNDQVGNVSTNVNNLAGQMSNLNQTMADITIQLNKQSEAINLLMERTKPKQIKHIIHHHKDKVTTYFINAVIPGRAWLIATNGSTLTVRKGTNIPGYGLVKLIDSIEGRIVMSSGRTIRFSQEDS